MAGVTYYDTSQAISGVAKASGSRESSKVVDVVIFNKDFDIENTDLTLEASWEDGVTPGTLADGIEAFIKDVNGSMPRPSDNTEEGYGRVKTLFKDSSYDVPYSHLGTDGNLELYSKLKVEEGNYSVGFIFEDMSMYVFVDDANKLIPMTILGAPVGNGEGGGRRFFEVNVQFDAVQLAHAVKVPRSVETNLASNK